MSSIVQLVQGSPAWAEHRRTHRNASETPAVLGVSPWQTAYQLWTQKMGLTEPEVTPAMLRGVQLEPAARAAYEARTGFLMQPAVLVAEGGYSCSLDGLTLGGERLLEVKCPVRGRESTLWQAATAAELPDHYRWQVQHQLMVSEAEVADVWVFDGSGGVLLEVVPDPGAWTLLRDAWDGFWEYLVSKSPPPLSKGDVRERGDSEWAAAARNYVETKLFADQARKSLAESKEVLVALTSHTSESGGGVTATRYWKTGAIEYKKIPELKGFDLEQYRGAPREETRVTIV